MYRIKNIAIFKPGPLDFNDLSTWQSRWELTLDNGGKILMKGRGFESGRRLDRGAVFVPVVGDWICFEGTEPRVFQFMKVLEVLGDRVDLSNGECCRVSGLYPGSAIPVKGDYIVRRTDGLCVVRKDHFEEENASLIQAMLKAVVIEVVKEAQEKKRRKVAS
jgi:hypothetical protein